eukprot:GDKI01036184.1.p1 GENE.GDKI01036184.1~~GDKI01036184.1.p1  ORF type:complete len:204 (-),score=92.46 GDKI01036184.1:124-735(-)
MPQMPQMPQMQMQQEEGGKKKGILAMLTGTAGRMLTAIPFMDKLIPGVKPEDDKPAPTLIEYFCIYTFTKPGAQPHCGDANIDIVWRPEECQSKCHAMNGCTEAAWGVYHGCSVVQQGPPYEKQEAIKAAVDEAPSAFKNLLEQQTAGIKKGPEMPKMPQMQMPKQPNMQQQQHQEGQGGRNRMNVQMPNIQGMMNRGVNLGA